MKSTDAPEAMTATVDVLVAGSVEFHDRDGAVVSTVSLVRDGPAIIVIDPGMVRDRSQILEPLEALGVGARDVTDVVLSHHHPPAHVRV
jgi:glyoxylase-like metal-dependent hydrolase (beta-lactamase superfamily II)